MKKSIIISIKPEWVEKILKKEKTIEIRRLMPKCDLPIDVYIYCTYGHLLTYDDCFNMYELYPQKIKEEGFGNQLNGKIVAKFTLNKVDKIFKYGNVDGNYQKLFKQSCLTRDELIKYLKNCNYKCYTWHIDNLEIFDKPMELSEFYRNVDDFVDARPCNCGKSCKYEDYDLQENQMICGIDYDGESCPFLKIQKAPQSWCYAYKEEQYERDRV